MRVGQLISYLNCLNRNAEVVARFHDGKELPIEDTLFSGYAGKLVITVPLPDKPVTK